MKTRTQIAFGSYQWILIYLGREKMRLKMLLLLPYRTVAHDFFLDILVFCLLPRECLHSPGCLHSPEGMHLSGRVCPPGGLQPPGVHGTHRGQL